MGTVEYIWDKQSEYANVIASQTIEGASPIGKAPLGWGTGVIAEH